VRVEGQELRLEGVTHQSGSDRGIAWRGALRRELVWLLLGKATALILLWMLFFSPAHRPDNSPAATSRHFSLEPPAAVTPRGRP
jgi:hypothetical protein